MPKSVAELESAARMKSGDQTAVVLGGGVFPSGELTTLSLQRLDAACKLFHDGDVPTVTVLGGKASTYLPHAIEYEVPGAEKRAKYLIEQMVPTEKIVRITDGKDTIGEAIACKNAFRVIGFAQFILVTSDIHMPRASWLFRKILGPHYEISEYSVPCAGLLLEEEENEYLAETKAYFEAHRHALDDTSQWHLKNPELYNAFKIIHDRFHPVGKESEAYSGVRSG